MCGRYGFDDDIRDERLADQLTRAAALAERLGVDMKTSGEIRPRDVAPVIAPSSMGRRMGAFPMRWGFVHPTKGMLVFNTRSETATKKPLFCTSVNDRRCLVPASRYFEWRKLEDGKKERYSFWAPDESPLYLGGLYVRSSREELPCFTILTRDATEDIRCIHPRMPVIIPFERAEEWLSPDTDFDTFLSTLTAPVRGSAE